MEERQLKTPLTIRGDSLYCPLSFQLDTYWNCLANCAHCYMRRLNRTWGTDLRPLDVSILERVIVNGLKKEHLKSPLDWAIKQKKTIRFGNKADPYQTAELTHRVSRRASEVLLKYGFSFVLQTMFTANVLADMDIFDANKNLVSFMPIVSPGLEKDWEVLERKATTNPIDRIKHASNWIKAGYNVGINGEPFIPGFHTVSDFEDTLKLLKSHGIPSYNTYHLHLNDLVAKNLHEVGLDIEKIWNMNKDVNWKPILAELIGLADKYGITLGCPDFVNSGKYQEMSNTCCGMNVHNPCTFNIINWKKGISFEESWDGVGDYNYGKAVYEGTVDNVYSLKDVPEILTENIEKLGGLFE